MSLLVRVSAAEVTAGAGFRGPSTAFLGNVIRICFLFQIERGNSFHNAAEAAFTLKLIQSLIASGVAGSVIGVITLYKAQMYKVGAT